MDNIQIFWVPICSEYIYFFKKVLDLFPFTVRKDLELHLVDVGTTGFIPVLSLLALFSIDESKQQTLHLMSSAIPRWFGAGTICSICG